MDKKELVIRVADQTGLSKRSAANAVDSIFQIIGNALEAEDSVRIFGFGIFEVRNCAPRTGRDLKTKKPIQIPARKIPAFRASSALKQRLK